MKTIQIGNRSIGPNEPCYIIAEAGVNHNGDLTLAKKLVDAAREAGADAVKFQKRKLSEVYQREILDEPRRGEQGLQYLVPLLVEFELPDEQFCELAAYSRSHDVTFLCTPWDKRSVDFLEGIDVPAYKIGSPDMTNLPLISYAARTRKPLLVSTGMSTEDEVRRTLSFINTLNVQCGVFHCVSAYPVAPDEINLRFMQKLQEWCSWPVGYSGHEQGIVVSTSAVAMGAKMLERHITLDRGMRGPDHRASLEPADFNELVRGVRETEAALGVPHRWFSRGEVLNRRILAKSLVAATDIPAGALITPELIATKSPGLGLSPQRLDELVGRRIRRDLRQDDVFTESDLQDEPERQVVRRIELGIDWGIVTRFDDLDLLVDRFAPQGMSFVELHLSDRDVDAGIDAFKSRRYQYGLVVHAPEYCHDVLIDLCAADVEQRSLSVQRIQKTIDLARELAGWFDHVPARGPKTIVHVGGMSPNRTGYDTVSAGHRLLESLRALDTDGVELLLENLPPHPWYFGGRWTGHMLVNAASTVKTCAESGVGLCFDTSHAALSCNSNNDRSLAGFAMLVRPYVRHLHLSDAAGISGEGLQVGDGQISFLDLWPLITPTEATCVPEIWQGHHDAGRGFQTALDRLAEIRWSAQSLAAVPEDQPRTELAKLIAPVGASIAAALRTIESNTLGIVFLVDERGVVKGVATDGDIRRALLAGHLMQETISDVMNRDFVFAPADASPRDVAARVSARCREVPILNSAGLLVGLASWPGLGAQETSRR